MNNQGKPVEAVSPDEFLRLKQELEGVKTQLSAMRRRKSSLLAMAVHDLRTPLAIIQGYSQLLAADLSPHANAEAREFIANIVAHADCIGVITENLVMYDQVERGELRLSFARCDLVELVDQAIAQAEGLTSLKNLTLRRAEASTSIWALVDEKQIRRVLYNLLSHVIKYARPDSDLSISATRQDSFGRVILTDTHRYLNADVLACLFELVEDSQGEATILKGMDMGLVVARHVVEAHGGRLEALCEPEMGTTLLLSLPLAEEEPDDEEGSIATAHE
jgi:signal transduction histidine kinase